MLFANIKVMSDKKKRFYL